MYILTILCGICYDYFAIYRESSVTDFGNRYDNAAAMEMLGGGSSQGISHKACMAALGYDWEIDMHND